MNCVNYVKKTVCMVLMLAFVLISCLGAFATSENPKKLGILASSIKITDTKVEYIEYKDDGAYFVEETISGNIITSDFYKISNCLLLLLWCFRHRVLFLLCVYSTAAFMAKSIH